LGSDARCNWNNRKGGIRIIGMKSRKTTEIWDRKRPNLYSTPFSTGGRQSAPYCKVIEISTACSSLAQISKFHSFLFLRVHRKSYCHWVVFEEKQIGTLLPLWKHWIIHQTQNISGARRITASIMRLATAMDAIRKSAIILIAVMLTSSHASLIQESNNGVRGASSDASRISPMQRIYGLENAAVRDAIHKIETESTHYRRTGVLSDTSHEVDYHAGHPLKPNRKLAEGDEVEDEENFFKPMRISFVTEALDNTRSANNGAQIDFVKEKVLPRMGEFWTEALNVVPVGSNDGKPLKIAAGELAQNVFCGHEDFTRVPASHIQNGVAETDMILYVSAAPGAQFCGPSTLAVAVACNFDQFDRPTAGAINFCLAQIDLDSEGTTHPSILQDNVDVAIHEAAHVFGMSSNSYKYFWDAEAVPPAPRTPRPIKPSTVTCVNGVERTLLMPDENTLKFLTAENGVRYASIVTPKVQVVVRNHFNCSDLEGAQLENQPTGASSCTGDHWDERQYYPESLSGVISPTTVILSPLSKLMERKVSN